MPNLKIMYLRFLASDAGRAACSEFENFNIYITYEKQRFKCKCNEIIADKTVEVSGRQNVIV